MTPDELQAARDLVAAATPGPWKTTEALEDTEFGSYVAYGVAPVAPLEWYADSDPAHTALEVMGKGDAELIAAAPDLITKLLDEVERLAIDKEAITAGILRLGEKLKAVRALEPDRARYNDLVREHGADYANGYEAATIQARVLVAPDSPPPDPPTPTYLDN